MPKVVAYAAFSASDRLSVTTIERRCPGPNDVLIEIRFSGIVIPTFTSLAATSVSRAIRWCLQDQITGVVAAVDRAVTKHAVGDRVEVGCMVDSCRACVNCRDGREQYCTKGAF